MDPRILAANVLLVVLVSLPTADGQLWGNGGWFQRQQPQQQRQSPFQARQNRFNQRRQGMSNTVASSNSVNQRQTSATANNVNQPPVEAASNGSTVATPPPPAVQYYCSSMERRTLFFRCARNFGMAHLTQFRQLARLGQCKVEAFSCRVVDRLVRCLNALPVRMVSSRCWPGLKEVLTSFLDQYNVPCKYQDLHNHCDRNSTQINDVAARYGNGGVNNARGTGTWNRGGGLGQQNRGGGGGWGFWG